MIDLHDVTQRLNMIASDPAMLNAFRRSNPEFVDLCALIAKPPQAQKPIGQFPPMSSLTAVQIALFDNGVQKGRGARYGMAVEFWTKTDINVKRKNFDRKANVILYDAKGLRAWLNRIIDKNAGRKFPLSREFIERLIEDQANMGDNDFIGLMCHSKPGDGTIYFDDQMIFVRLDGEDTKAVLFLGVGDHLILPRFSKTDRAGNAHGGNVILQCRCDLIGFDPLWATDDFEADA